VVAAAVAVATVPGAVARSAPEAGLRLVDIGPRVISPNGNGVNDAVQLKVSTPTAARVGLRAYFWGGRQHGWRRLRTGVTVSPTGAETTISWNATTAGGHVVNDGSYVLTVCRPGGRLLPPLVPLARQRPGTAEASVSRPPWRRTTCLARPKVVRVERIAAWVDSTDSYAPGARVPLVVSADRGRASVGLQQDCSNARIPLGPQGALPEGIPAGLYHYVVTDPGGDQFRAPVVVRNGAFPVDRPPSHTALVVWPYLTWRAYNAYDANLDGRPDSWYQFWRQRRVSLVGTILPRGVEDDHAAALPFSRWLCNRGVRVQSITDVELGRLPLSTLRRYSAIVYPGHSEYYEPKTYDLLMRYRKEGGNLVFFQANPFYRQVRVDRERNAVVMTDYDAREGRSDFAIAGVGYDGCCFPPDQAQPYVAARGSAYARVRWLFRGTGIGPGQRFGFAGSESDRIDPALTPHDHVVAAEAIVAGNHGVIHASMTWSRAGRGSSFATGNYDFMRMRRSITWKLLDNVWRKLVGQR
jgi:hypothetical protein